MVGIPSVVTRNSMFAYVGWFREFVSQVQQALMALAGPGKLRFPYIYMTACRCWN